MPRMYAPSPEPDSHLLASIQLGGTARIIARKLILDYGGPKAADLMEESYPGIGRGFVRELYKTMRAAGELPPSVPAPPPGPQLEPPTAPPAPHFQDRD